MPMPISQMALSMVALLIFDAGSAAYVIHPLLAETLGRLVQNMGGKSYFDERSALSPLHCGHSTT
eukprot:2444934-Pyramimonas_sp.AAC.1